MWNITLYFSCFKHQLPFIYFKNESTYKEVKDHILKRIERYSKHTKSALSTNYKQTPYQDEDVSHSYHRRLISNIKRTLLSCSVNVPPIGTPGMVITPLMIQNSHIKIPMNHYWAIRDNVKVLELFNFCINESELFERNAFLGNVSDCALWNNVSLLLCFV